MQYHFVSIYATIKGQKSFSRKSVRRNKSFIMIPQPGPKNLSYSVSLF